MKPQALDAVAMLCREHGFPEPELEVRFHPVRKWRADYLWPEAWLILELEGGLFLGGHRPGSRLAGHSSAKGILRDMEKSNAAQLMGYRYLRLAPWQVDLALVPLLHIAFSPVPALRMARVARTGGR